MRLRSVTRLATYSLRRPVRTTRLVFSRHGWSGLYWYAVNSTSRGVFSAKQPVSNRSYRSYGAYLAHQRSKLALLDLTEYDRAFRAGLASRLVGGRWAGRSVLCLAARIGTEVKAFHDVGAFAVGIDLNPGPTNNWVLPGDFHQLVFASASVDTVYCNSLDHALDLPRILAEVRRVLKPGAMLLIDAQQGADDVPFDQWAATSWRSVDDLVKVVENNDFTLTDRCPISLPFTGEQLTFRTPG